MAAHTTPAGQGAHSNPNDAPLDWRATPAYRDVVDAIAANRAPIRFSEFMRIALYGKHGYYTTPRDRRTDYLTSPQTHPEFGACIARCLRQMWQNMGAPERWNVVELGAGDGKLRRDVLGAVARTEPPDDPDDATQPTPSFAGALAYRAYDLGADASSAASGVEPAHALDDSPPDAQCVLSNELLDAFPADRFVIRNGRPRQLLVDVSPTGKLTHVEAASAADAVPKTLADALADHPDGYIAEVAVGVEDWAADIAAMLATGYVLTIDYGHPDDALYAPERRGGTLRTHHQHALGSDPFRAVGEQDLTTHVDFSRLHRAMLANGFHPAAPLMSQAQFLDRYGYHDALIAARRQLAATRSPNETARAEADLRDLRELGDPRGLGAFLVAVHRRNAAPLPDRAAPTPTL